MFFGKTDAHQGRGGQPVFEPPITKAPKPPVVP
jgi:hypothetical protein